MKNVSGIYAILVTDRTLNVDVSAGAAALTFPTPANGLRFVVKDSHGNSATNPITMVPHAGEKIEGIAGNRVCSADWNSWTWYSDGVDWFLE